MKKNSFVKKKLLLLGALLISLKSYYEYDIDYINKVTYIEDEAFARYSKGLVYIGDKEFLSSINQDIGDVLIEDRRDSIHDPNMTIYNSYLIDDKYDRNEILEILCEYEKVYPTSWNRTIESMRVEWFLHNLSYKLNFDKERSKNVDLNNLDEEKYNSEFIRKLLKL